jgi:hypothetical protein
VRELISFWARRLVRLRLFFVNILLNPVEAIRQVSVFEVDKSLPGRG